MGMDHQEKAQFLTMSKPWIIDSGCSTHMTYDRSLFKEFDKFTSGKVIIGNGSHIAIKGRGTIVVKSNLGLKLILNVLYLPEIDQNFLSVAQLLEEDYKVLFEQKSCVIKDQNNKEVIRAPMKNNMFVLDLITSEDIIDKDEEKKKKESKFRVDYEDASVLKKMKKMKNLLTSMKNKMLLPLLKFKI